MMLMVRRMMTKKGNCAATNSIQNRKEKSVHFGGIYLWFGYFDGNSLNFSLNRHARRGSRSGDSEDDEDDRSDDDIRSDGKKN